MKEISTKNIGLKVLIMNKGGGKKVLITNKGGGKKVSEKIKIKSVDWTRKHTSVSKKVFSLAPHPIIPSKWR